MNLRYPTPRPDVSTFATPFLSEATMKPTEELELRVNEYHTSLSPWDCFALRFGFRQEPPHIWAYEIEIERRNNSDCKESKQE